MEVFLALQQRAFRNASDERLARFAECLRSNKVEFLIVGALAVPRHGFPRYSGELDLFVKAWRGERTPISAVSFDEA